MRIGWKGRLCAGLLTLFLSFGTAWAADNLAGEIAYLIDFVRHSSCTFIRNGTEYKGPAAADHVQAKYDYYKSDVKTVDDFIKHAATKSILSGEPYKVRCSDGKTVLAADWLRAQYHAHLASENAGTGN